MKKFFENKGRTGAYLILASLFFVGNIMFFKMVLHYLGLRNGLTVAATGIFALLAGFLLAYFLQYVLQEKKLYKLLALIGICLLYMLPYLVHGMFYQLIQCCLFMVPFGLAAYLLTSEETGSEAFFTSFHKLSRFAVFPFLLYILVLFVGETGPEGIIMVAEMSYGVIALAALPFLYAGIHEFFSATGKEKLFSGLRTLVFQTTILYSGTRSVILCMAAAYLVQLVLNRRQLLSMKRLQAVVSAAAVILTTVFCLTVVPKGSRLNVFQDDLLYELNAEANKISVYCVETQQETKIGKAFEYYIINRDAPLTQTLAMLYQDIETNAGTYIVVPAESKEASLRYRMHANNRAHLWSLALGEFAKAPVLGNGIHHYQQKYEGKFPHNVVLELLCDFGVVGTVLFAAFCITSFLYCAVQAHKRHDAWLGQLLGFLVCYIPMHLLFHSLYFNGVLFFTLSLLLFIPLKLRYSAQLPADAE